MLAKPTKFKFVLCSYNRVQTTLSALRSIYDQANNENFIIEVILVDDNSNDNTVHEVSIFFPEVEIINGSGNLYWSGAMRLGIEQALIENNFDYLVLLNDDVTLFEGIFSSLLMELRMLGNKKAVFVGSLIDVTTGELLYGGRYFDKRSFKKEFKLLPPNKTKQCNTFNGNFVCVPKYAFIDIGNIDKAFTHSLGDFDLGLRLTGKGYKIICLKMPVGNCLKNESNPFQSPTFKDFLTPKRLPVKPWFLFTKRHFGFLWFIYFIYPYCKYLILKIIK